MAAIEVSNLYLTFGLAAITDELLKQIDKYNI
jgi:hypothetical protein